MVKASAQTRSINLHRNSLKCKAILRIIVEGFPRLKAQLYSKADATDLSVTVAMTECSIIFTAQPAIVILAQNGMIWLKRSSKKSTVNFGADGGSVTIFIVTMFIVF